MPTDSIDIQVRAVCAVPEGCALFLGNANKVFVIHIDPVLGQAITSALRPSPRTRPMTHDLMANIFAGFGIGLERVIINDATGDTFYARVILRMENELGVKMVEADARPSDSIILALNAKRPMGVSKKLWEKLPDSTALMERLVRGKN
jgi:bifunctional DNase/RNase